VRTAAPTAFFASDDHGRVGQFDARTGKVIRYITRGHGDYQPDVAGDWLYFRRDGRGAACHETPGHLMRVPISGHSFAKPEQVARVSGPYDLSRDGTLLAATDFGRCGQSAIYDFRNLTTGQHNVVHGAWNSQFDLFAPVWIGDTKQVAMTVPKVGLIDAVSPFTMTTKTGGQPINAQTPCRSDGINVASDAAGNLYYTCPDWHGGTNIVRLSSNGTQQVLFRIPRLADEAVPSSDGSSVLVLGEDRERPIIWVWHGDKARRLRTQHYLTFAAWDEAQPAAQ
jgi:hypothetical protein